MSEKNQMGNLVSNVSDINKMSGVKYVCSCSSLRRRHSTSYLFNPWIHSTHQNTPEKNIWCYLVLHWTHQKTPFQSFHHNLPPPSLLSHNILTRVPTWDTILLCHMRQCTEHFCQVMSYSKEVVLGETNLTFQVNILKNSHGPLFFANYHQPFPLLVKTPLIPCSLFQIL